MKLNQTFHTKQPIMETTTFSNAGSSSLKRFFTTGLMLLLLTLGNNLWSQVIFTRAFTGTGACPTQDNAALSGTGWTAASVTRSAAGVTCNATNNVINNSFTATGATIDATKYVEFTFTVNSGYQATLSSVSFASQRSATGPQNARVAHDNSGNFTTDFQNFAPPTASAGTNWDFTDFTITGPATRTFRIFGWNNTGGTLRFDDISLIGTVTSTASPGISVSSNNLNNVVVVNGGGASSAVTFNVGGTNLTGNITITPPVGIEMSVVGAGGPYTFSNATPISLTPSSGTVASTPVWARIVSGSPSGIFANNIVTSTSGAPNENTVFNGQVFTPPSVVINQGYNASGNNPAGTEWYELLTLQNVDMRNWIFRDYSGGAPNTADQLLFNNIAFWSNIPAGTYIVIYQPGFTTPVEDLDPTDDGIIKVQACNATYFTQTASPCVGATGNSMAMNATQDALQIVNASSAVIHSLEWNSSATEYSGINIVRYPKIFLNNSTLAPAGIAATASAWMVSTNGVDDFYNNANVAESGLQTPVNSTEGLANDATQNAWVCGTVRGITEPSVAASALNCTGVTSNDITFNWTNGNGSRRLIVQRSGAGAVAPIDGTNYTVGGTTGAGNSIIYLGTGVNTLNISSLSASTSYTFDVYEINGNGECINYAPAASVTQVTAVGTSITLNPIAGTPFCVSPTSLSASLTADFTTLGTFNVGNTFTVQLSSAAGSFATPINIGSGSATGISANIPAGTAAGAGYLIRVVASNPFTTSTTQAITINAAPVNVSGQSALSGSSAATINWTNPTVGCYNDIMIVAKATAFTAAVPTGNTLVSNSNNFTDVTNDLFDGGVVVYKGNTPGQVITGLTNGTAYNFKIFTRTGNDWSNGVVVTATPVFTLNVGDIQFVGMNTAAPDGFSFVTWVNIPAGSVIKFMDNGFLAGVSATATNNCRCTENQMTWTAPVGGVAIGRVVNILDADASANAVANIGTCVGELNGLSNSGDQIFAFTGASPANANPTTFSGSIIAAINMHPTLNFITTGVASSNTSYLPTELSAVPESNISFTGSALNATFTNSRSNQTTWAAYKPIVDANASWTTASTATNPFSTTNFTLSSGLPDVQLNVSATSGTEAGSTVITLTAAVTGTTVAPQTVDIAVSGTGITATDYVLSNTTITIPAGVNPTGTVTFTISNDVNAEGIETAEISILNPSAGLELGTFILREVAITDNDVPNLVITEIMYDGPGLDNEWIEFHNAGTTPVTINNLFQLTSTNNPWTYTFTGTTVMPAGAYFTVQVGTNGSFPFTPTFVGFSTGTDRLQNTSSTITLKFNSLNVDVVTYGNGAPWPGVLANGGGSSVSLNQVSADNALGANWGACYIGGTPNAANINCSSTIFYTVTSGNITDQIWSTLPTGPAIYANFSSGTDLVVQNGHTVLMNNSSAVPVRNLTINGGFGKVWRNSAISTNMAYFSLHGNLVNNGIIGNGNTFDAIGLNIEGTSCTISGSGTFNLGRLRKNENVNASSTVTINTNTAFNLRFPGTSIYNNFTGATTFNVIIPAGKFVNVFGDGSTNGDVSIDGVDGLGIAERGGLITVNGTLRVLGKIYALTNNTSALNGILIGSTGSVNTRDLDLRIDGAADIGFSMNVNAGGKLTVNGTMRNLAGVFNTNGGLILTSGASLLHGVGTPGLGADPGADVTGNVTVKRIGTTAVGSYNFWSSPVSGTNLTSIGNGGLYQGSALSTYAYDPNSANGFTVQGYRAGWMSQTLSNGMTPAAGYITTAAGTATFVGPVNNGNISLPLVQGAFTRFNLVGNPYPCAISAGSFLAANTTQIAGAVYFWDDDESIGSGYSDADYIVTNALGTSGTGGNGNATNFLGNIASGQGFFVEALPAGTQVNFTNTMRNNDNAFFFDANSVQKMWVKVSNNEGLQNETLIAFLDEATDNPDHQFDAHKLPGNEFISIYSTNETENFAIQAWKNITNERVIGLGVDATVTGMHAIGIPRIENIDATTLVYLEDTETGAYHNLRNGDYQFQVNEAVSGTGRFFLHFIKAVEVGATAETCNSNDGSIQLTSAPNIWSYSLVNANNETISEGAIETETSINNLDAGNYTLRFHAYDGYTTVQNVEVVAGAPVQVEVLAITNTTVGEVASFTANSVNATEITWNFGDGSAELTGNVVSHTYDMPGVYTVTASATNGACAAVNQQTIAITANTTSINQVISETVNIYPNPANNFFTITLNKEVKAVVEITDLAGKLIRTENINGQMPNVISTSELSNGIYLLNISSNNTTETIKLSVNH